MINSVILGLQKLSLDKVMEVKDKIVLLFLTKDLKFNFDVKQLGAKKTVKSINPNDIEDAVLSCGEYYASGPNKDKIKEDELPIKIFDYGQIVSLRKPKVALAYGPSVTSEGVDESTRKMLFKEFFDFFAFCDKKKHNYSFIPLLYHKDFPPKLWLHLIYTSLSRYIQINPKTQLKYVILFSYRNQRDSYAPETLKDLEQFYKK